MALTLQTPQTKTATVLTVLSVVFDEPSSQCIVHYVDNLGVEGRTAVDYAVASGLVKAASTVKAMNYALLQAGLGPAGAGVVT